MTVVSPVFVLVSIALALMTASVLFKYSRVGFNDQNGGARYVSIDGLRGYLAFFVFLHHSCIWFFYLQTGRWELPPSNLFVQLGQGSVALFFMVTSFLFVSKMLDEKAQRIDWLKLYASRVARLFPLYLLALSFVFLFAAFESDWKLAVSVEHLLTSVFKWITFTINGKPDINGVKNTSIMIASVTWSLPYEWFFYLCLPLFAACMTGRLYWWGIVFSVVSLQVMLDFWSPRSIVLTCFSGGVVAAIAVRFQFVGVIAGKWYSTAVVIASLAAILFFKTAYDPVALFLLSLVFLIVAAGNDIFGVLRITSARWLGELSYGVYLLHGLVLFFVFNFVIGYDDVRKLEPLKFWALLFLITPVVLGVAHIAHFAVERPAMRKVKSLLFASGQASVVKVKEVA